LYFSLFSCPEFVSTFRRQIAWYWEAEAHTW
jgi:hypothetical protein